eukprot:scaffold21103_cov36-Tisochrysis_lutea.AAC.1
MALTLLTISLAGVSAFVAGGRSGPFPLRQQVSLPGLGSTAPYTFFSGFIPAGTPPSGRGEMYFHFICAMAPEWQQMPLTIWCNRSEWLGDETLSLRNVLSLCHCLRAKMFGVRAYSLSSLSPITNAIGPNRSLAHSFSMRTPCVRRISCRVVYPHPCSTAGPGPTSHRSAKSIRLHPWGPRSAPWAMAQPARQGDRPVTHTHAVRGRIQALLRPTTRRTNHSSHRFSPSMRSRNSRSLSLASLTQGGGNPFCLSQTAISRVPSQVSTCPCLWTLGSTIPWLV